MIKCFIKNEDNLKLNTASVMLQSTINMSLSRNMHKCHFEDMRKLAYSDPQQMTTECRWYKDDFYTYYNLRK